MQLKKTLFYMITFGVVHTIASTQVEFKNFTGGTIILQKASFENYGRSQQTPIHQNGKTIITVKPNTGFSIFSVEPKYQYKEDLGIFKPNTALKNVTYSLTRSGDKINIQ